MRSQRPLSWNHSRCRVDSFRPHGLCRLQRLSFDLLGRLWLPSSPFALSVPLGPCGSLAVKPDRLDRSNRSPPLVPFTPSRRLDLNFAAFGSVLNDCFYTTSSTQRHLTQASLPFSMSKRKGPSFPLNLSTQRLQNVARLWRSSTLRVWLPSQRLPSSFRP
jgi:hypothetical protein